MTKERFLLYMLAGIFTFQAGVFGFGLYHCAYNGGLKACPEIGERYEQTFTTMTAVVLALITGASIKES
jgi:hypothetical protein